MDCGGKSTGVTSFDVSTRPPSLCSLEGWLKRAKVKVKAERESWFVSDFRKQSRDFRHRKKSPSNKRNWKSELMQRYFSTDQIYNKIYVCEALPDNDLSTGIQLARDTLKPLCDTKGVGLEA